MYNIRLQTADNRETIDERKVSTDEELFGFVGKWGIWYFLALEGVDYNDAAFTLWGKKDGSDTLLAFTALKETDKPNGPHRHGLPRGKLAYGNANDVCGKWVRVEIVVEIID